MHDRPDTVELLEAVREFLLDEVTPTLTDQRLKFRALIAMNVLAIAERQIQAGDGDLDLALARLRSLDTPFNIAPRSESIAGRTEVDSRMRELCAAIRAGSADHEAIWQPAFDFALWHVESKLRVSNPRFRLRQVIDPIDPAHVHGGPEVGRTEYNTGGTP